MSIFSHKLRIKEINLIKSVLPSNRCCNCNTSKLHFYIESIHIRESREVRLHDSVTAESSVALIPTSPSLTATPIVTMKAALGLPFLSLSIVTTRGRIKIYGRGTVRDSLLGFSRS